VSVELPTASRNVLCLGDDDWGRWLRGRLERAGVDLDHFKLIEDMPTPLALTTVDLAGEPTFRIYGEAIAPFVNALADSVEAAATANACVPVALLVRANAAEAQLLTDEDDVERAALKEAMVVAARACERCACD
jgi:sugar/nucleoside kinase (ribokinase family)